MFSAFEGVFSVLGEWFQVVIILEWHEFFVY